MGYFGVLSDMLSVNCFVIIHDFALDNHFLNKTQIFKGLFNCSGLGYDFGPQRIRGLDIMCPLSLSEGLFFNQTVNQDQTYACALKS